MHLLLETLRLCADVWLEVRMGPMPRLSLTRRMRVRMITSPLSPDPATHTVGVDTSSVRLVTIILMGRIKSGRPTIDRCDHERLSHVEDHTFALVGKIPARVRLA